MNYANKNILNKGKRIVIPTERKSMEALIRYASLINHEYDMAIIIEVLRKLNNGDSIGSIEDSIIYYLHMVDNMPSIYEYTISIVKQVITFVFTFAPKDKAKEFIEYFDPNRIIREFRKREK